MANRDREDLVAGYLALSDDDLYILIADEVVAGAGPLDEEQHRFLGRAWFEAQAARLRNRICAEKSIQDPNDRLITSLALLDVLTGEMGDSHLPAIAAASVLLARVGLDRFCQDYDQVV